MRNVHRWLVGQPNWEGFRVFVLTCVIGAFTIPFTYFENDAMGISCRPSPSIYDRSVEECSMRPGRILITQFNTGIRGHVQSLGQFIVFMNAQGGSADGPHPSANQPGTAHMLVAPFSAKDARRSQQKLAALLQLPIVRKSSIGLELVLIPPGTFPMGSGPEAVRPADDEASVKVTLTELYYIGKFEVTQEQYETVMGENKSYFGQWLVWDTRDWPAESLSRTDAMDFCHKLTEIDRKAGVIPEDWEYTLPSEAQWEYACRAGTTTETHFGNQLSSKDANFNGGKPFNGAVQGPYLERPAKVGSYSANAFGLHDMHGNVDEWCLDMYQKELPGGVDPLVAPIEREDAEFAVRGGDWFMGGWQCRSANRFSYSPERFAGTVGFRVVLQKARKR